jgi:cytochrome c oxidase subunit 1
MINDNYLTNDFSLKSWFLTSDHKRIAILYLISITLAFVVGATAAGIIRIHLLSSKGLLVNADTYNRLFTLHGIVMVWFFLIPSIPNVLGNFLVPLMIGAKDLAFPKLNLLSWYFYVIGALFTFAMLIRGGVDTGWTFYTPYSTQYSNSYVVLAATGIFIAGLSSILTGLNFIVTIHRLRSPNMGWFQMPLFIWSIYATSLILILATPVLGMTLILVAIERLSGVGIFNPALGGDPLLFQHLFWFYSHPAVYIMILPGMGVISEIIPCFSRRPIFGYRFIAFSSVAIAMLGFLVWGHHMFVSGQSAYADLVFSILSFLVAIPSAIKVFNWTATLYKGRITISTPMLYAMAFIALFTVGGLTGLILATLAINVHVHDTYFVVAHFHFIMVGGMVSAYLGGIHFWWPKITGRIYPEKWGKFSVIMLFMGFVITFMPQFILGYLGMPRRYHSYAPDLQIFHVISTCGIIILGIGYLIPLIYLSWSFRYGPGSTDNPWNAKGLEWQSPTPPPKENFLETPIVPLTPYDYSPELEVLK